MVTGKKIIVIQITFKNLYLKNHEMNLELLSIEVWDYASSTSLQNTIVSILTFSRTCKFEGEFVTVIVIDSKKRTAFGIMHMTFEFHGRD